MIFLGGPYYIATAVEQPPLNGGTRAQLYWRVEVSKLKDDESTLQYRITCTDDFEKACNFYLKPFEEKYFLIATDPEDTRITDQLQEVDKSEESHTPNATATTPQSATVSEEPNTCTPSQPMTEEQPGTTTMYIPPPAVRVYERVPQRFVRMHKQDGDVHLSAEMVINKKTAAFKLKYPHHIKSHQTLSKSQWLPEAALGSEPYFISLRGSSFQHKSASILSVGEENGKYVITCDHSDNIDKQLFVLKLGHKT